MAHSRETEHYQLPLYDGTDIINPLTDFNEANEAIDEAIYNANQHADSAVSTAQGAVQQVGTYDERITAAQEAADGAVIKSDNIEAMMAEKFNPLKEGGYQIDDVVIYNGKLYTFINPHTGAWDAGDVKVTTIGDAVGEQIAEGKQEIAEETAAAIAEIAGQSEKVIATQAMIAPAFDKNKQGGYAAYDFVVYADKLYMFTEPHNGDWTGIGVEQKTIAEMLMVIQHENEESEG